MRIQELVQEGEQKFLETLANYLHNEGHTAIGLDCSPEGSGPMSHSEASARDPIFYQWHQAIEDLVQGFTDQHKEPYSKEDFDVRGGIEVKEVSTILTHQDVTLTNQLVTHMEVKTLNVRENIKINYNRLNHLPFKSKIKMSNPQKLNTKIMVRVFLAALKVADDPK